MHRPIAQATASERLRSDGRPSAPASGAHGRGLRRDDRVILPVVEAALARRRSDRAAATPAPRIRARQTRSAARRRPRSRGGSGCQEPEAAWLRSMVPYPPTGFLVLERRSRCRSGHPGVVPIAPGRARASPCVRSVVVKPLRNHDGRRGRDRRPLGLRGRPRLPRDSDRDRQRAGQGSPMTSSWSRRSSSPDSGSSRPSASMMRSHSPSKARRAATTESTYGRSSAGIETAVAPISTNRARPVHDPDAKDNGAATPVHPRRSM